MKYTKEVLTKAIAENQSMAGVMRSLGANQSGGLHCHLLLKAREWGIDMSHFLGQAGDPDKKKPKAHLISMDSACVEGSTYHRGHLKRRLIELGKLRNECNICGQQSEWQGKKLVMVMDHINGIRDDNRIENLRLLCPNCNSQQDTFCRVKISMVKRFCSGCGRVIAKRNKKVFCSKCLFKESLRKLVCPSCGGVKGRSRIVCDECSKGRVPELAAGVKFRTSCESLVGSNPTMPTIAKSVCPECGGWKKVESPRCKFCSHKRSCKVERPSMAELGKMVETIPMTSIASKYGVSGTAVKKWCVSYGIKISNRLGYWAKKRSVTETI